MYLENTKQLISSINLVTEYDLNTCLKEIDNAENLLSETLKNLYDHVSLCSNLSNQIDVLLDDERQTEKFNNRNLIWLERFKRLCEEQRKVIEKLKSDIKT